MGSNQHKMNHPIVPPPTMNPYPGQDHQQYFNFESSSYGYGFRNWVGESHVYNQQQHVPQLSQAEIQQQQEAERQKQLVEKAKNELLARFPFYAINMQNDQRASNQYNQFSTDQIPMPIEPPKPVEAPTYPNAYY